MKLVIKKSILTLASVLPFLTAAHAVAPLKVLLILGGCCHDYAKQQFILQEGLETRANVAITIEYNPSTDTKPNFDIYKKADWAKGYDVIIHDECAGGVGDQKLIDNILNAHKEIPAVNLHCAMHSYRRGDFKRPVKATAMNADWYNMLGLQSCGHGPQLPITLNITDKEHPITKGIEAWTTGKEELYNNVQGMAENFKTFKDAHPIMEGKQEAGDKDGVNHSVVAWTNLYGPKKTRIFSTTLGHNNETVADGKYLDLVTRGLLWSVNKLDDNGKPLPGYESQKK